MILLDTNAVLWILAAHERAVPLRESAGRLYLSPVVLLELKFLVEAGRLRELPGRTVLSLTEDQRWSLDSPASDVLFRWALDLEWTRDPFDRLIVAHARYRRWRLATGDRRLTANLRVGEVLAL
jgi:PIN domain nuclease of toxin-antitoxin system